MTRKTCPIEALLKAQRAQIERLETAAKAAESVDLKLEDALMRAIRQQATLFADARKLRETGPAAPEKGGAQRPSISIVYDYGDESHSPDVPGTV